MADFGIQSTQLQAPSGAGTNPISPATAGPLDNGVGNLIGSIANIFEKGLANDAKSKAAQAEQNVVGSYAKKLQGIEDALASGQIRPSEAGTKKRALHSEYVGGYSQYVEGLDKVRKSFGEGTQLGVAEEQIKAEQDLRKTRILDAQKAGFPITVGMSQNTIDNFVNAHQTAVRTDEETRKFYAQQAEDRAAGKYSKEQEDRERKDHSIALMNNIVDVNLKASVSYAEDIGNRFRSGSLTPEQAQFEWARYNTNIQAQIQAAAGVEPGLASTYRNIFEDLKVTGAKQFEPGSDLKQVEDEIKLIIGRQKLVALTKPNIAPAVAMSQLFGNNPAVALKFDSSIISAATDMSVPLTTNGVTKTVVMGNPAVQSGFINITKENIKKLNNNGFPDNAKATEELTNTVNNSLSQIGDLMGKTGVDKKTLDEIAEFISSPEYGKFASTHKLDSNANSAAIKAFQMDYDKVVIKGVDNILTKTHSSIFSGKDFVLPSDAIKATFNGSGVTFELVKQPSYVTDRKLAQQALGELQQSQVAVNRLLHKGAHMEGTVDYGKYWEANKHLLLPKLFSKYEGLDIGQKVNGKTYLGGDANDAANWR